jgi:hypothetical protein
MKLSLPQFFIKYDNKNILSKNKNIAKSLSTPLFFFIIPVNIFLNFKRPFSLLQTPNLKQGD